MLVLHIARYGRVRGHDGQSVFDSKLHVTSSSMCNICMQLRKLVITDWGPLFCDAIYYKS